MKAFQFDIPSGFFEKAAGNGVCLPLVGKPLGFFSMLMAPTDARGLRIALGGSDHDVRIHGSIEAVFAPGMASPRTRLFRARGPKVRSQYACRRADSRG